MLHRSMWCLFLLIFGLTIGGIQTLGWWVRPAAAQSSATASVHSTTPHAPGEPMHWRSLVMQQ